MKTLTRVKQGLDKVLEFLCVALFMLLVVVVSWQVFARQILHDPSGWTETISRYLFIWLALLGAALVFGERGHIAIDLLIQRLAPRAQRILAVIIQGIVIVFATFIMVWGGWRVAMVSWDQNLTGIPTTIGPWYLVLPLSGLMVIFYSIYHAISITRGIEPPVPGLAVDAD